MSIADLIIANPSLDDAGILDKASVPTVTTATEIPRAVFVRYLMATNGMYARIVAAQLNANPQIAGLAVTALGWLASPDFTFVMWADPLLQQCMTGLVAAGIFTPDEESTARAELLDTISYPCGPTIPTLADIAAARAQMIDDASKAAEQAAAEAKAKAEAQAKADAEVMAKANALALAAKWTALFDAARKQFSKVAALQASGSPPPADLTAVAALPDSIVPTPSPVDRQATIAALTASNHKQHNTICAELQKMRDDPTITLPADISVMGVAGGEM